MPVYEFICRRCDRPSRQQFSYSEYGSVEPKCPYCGSQNIKRRIGRVAVAKSEDARMEAMMSDAAFDQLDEEDPKQIGRFMRKMSQEMGEDLGDEFDEVVDRLEKGESPESIEQSMPDLGMGGDDLVTD